MPIEFHCSECYAQVITPDDTAGKQGRCPNCSAVLRIPERNPSAVKIVTPTSPAQPVATPASSQPLADPFKPTGQKTIEQQEIINKQFGFDQWEEKREEETWGEDTDLSYKMRKMVIQERLKNSIVGPAQCLVVTAAVNLIIVTLAILGLTGYVIYNALQSLESNTILVTISGIIIAIVLMSSTMIMIGANHMRKTRSYSVAYMGAVIALLPLNLLFFLSIPFGVWAILILNDTAIAEGFKRR
ncbi:MAG: hypothetical protein VX438_12835 [Planctomycetota bacterium]|nr:hypothetical protein [Planctomycetota bacterium]